MIFFSIVILHNNTKVSYRTFFKTFYMNTNAIEENISYSDLPSLPMFKALKPTPLYTKYLI